MAAMTIVASPISGRIVGRHGVRWVLVAGGLGIGAGSLMLTSLDAHTPILWLLAAYFVFGIGFGAVNPPITNTAVSGMPPSQAGVAAAVASTSRQVGQTLGVAVVGAVATAGVARSLHDDLATASHPAWWVVAGLAAAVVALGLAASTTAAKASAERTAARLDDGLATAAVA
jgi:MFS family permease